MALTDLDLIGRVYFCNASTGTTPPYLDILYLVGIYRSYSVQQLVYSYSLGPN
jgi:hypothetical protein